MAKIILVDNGITFDGDTLKSKPLGGAETAFISLAESLAELGHDVIIYNKCNTEIQKNKVNWKPLGQMRDQSCDLYIANRSHSLLELFPKAKQRIFWIHNPANYLLKWRYLKPLWKWRPIIIFSSQFHVDSLPKWVPTGGRLNIPYGISSDFIHTAKLKKAPKPKAIFTSSPLRSLEWLLTLWEEKIFPKIPNAELHIFSSPKTYGEHGDQRLILMNRILNLAKKLKRKGVILRDPLPKKKLAKEINQSRVILYRGDPGETYCLAIGESQACGVPAVVQNIGCVAERVVDKVTGYVAKDDEEFCENAIEILSNDLKWKEMHEAAIRLQRNWTWKNAAIEIEKLVK